MNAFIQNSRLNLQFEDIMVFSEGGRILGNSVSCNNSNVKLFKRRTLTNVFFLFSGY